MKIKWLILGTLIVAIAIITMIGFMRFRRDIRSAKERIGIIDSQVIDTDCGPIEYVDKGDGFPVLVIHGIFGGFDQGLITAGGNLGDGYLSIVPSRFGYLGTPLPDDATTEKQADAYTCLLDTLGIEEAVVMATSAGGTSAIQFALRHPDRCSALILISSNAPGETEAGLPPKPVAKAAFKSDFIFWLLTTYFRSSMNSIMGVPEGFELTPKFEVDVAEIMKTVLPVNPRSEGAIFDMFTSNPDINTGYPLEKINVPVLIMSAVDDPLALYVNAKTMAEKIPGAKLVTIESGGHMMLGNEERIKKEISSFLEKQNLSIP